MKAFITGADGLLGANLVRKLLQKGWDAKALVFPASKSSTLDGLDIEKVQGDLLESGFPLADAVKGCDALFHCAAVTTLWADPEIMWKVNLDGTRRILEAALRAGVKRAVFVGSASSYQPGTIEDPADETAPFPEVYKGAPYMESKHAAAELARKFNREKDMEVVIVAPTFMLGPHDSGPSGGQLVLQYLKRKPPFVTEGGRNFAYAPDVAKGVLLAFEKGRPGESYILGGENLTYLDFFTRLASVAGVKPPRGALPGAPVLLAGAAASAVQKITGWRLMFNLAMARFSLLGAYYSPAKAVGELGVPQTPVETAIRDSIHALREYGHL